MIIGAEVWSSDPISIYLLPFDSSHQDESNGMCFISLASMLTDLWLFIKAFNNSAKIKANSGQIFS